MSTTDAFVDAIATAVARVVEPIVTRAVSAALAERGADNDGTRLLKLDEAAKKLGVSKRQVERFIAQRRLGVVRLGPGGTGRPLVRLEELQRFIDEGEE